MKSFFFTLLVASFSAGVSAQVHKCQTPDGRTVFRDRPCEGTSNSAKPTRQLAPMTNIAQPTAAQLSQQFDDKWKTQIDALEPLLAQCNAPKSNVNACAEYERKKDAIFTASKGDFQQMAKSYLSEANSSCQNGDAKACRESDCGTIGSYNATKWDRRRPDEFLACARNLGLKSGKFWVLAGGKHGNDAVDPKYLQKLDHGSVWKNPLVLRCFRKPASANEAFGSLVRVVEYIHILKPNGNLSYHFTYAIGDQNSKGKGEPKEYPSLEELAEQICER